MAENNNKKSTNKTAQSKTEKAVKKAVKKTTKKVVKKAAKNKNVQIALVVLVVLLVIAVVTVYIVKPEIFTDLFASSSQTGDDSGNNNGNNNPPIIDNPGGEDNNPGGEDNNPGGEDNNPGGEDNNPGGEDNNPGGEDNNPGGEFSGDLAMHMIDIGQGDCVYIKLPDGKDMLIDAGNETNTSAYINPMLDYLDNQIEDDTIEYLMLTHSDQDHVSYLDEVLDKFQVSNIYMPFILSAPTNAEMAAKVNALAASDTRIAALTDPDTISTKVYAEFFIAAFSEPNCNIFFNVGIFDITGENYSIEFFCYSEEEWAQKHVSGAEDKNAVSPIGILSYNGKRIVLTGDSNEKNEPKFIEKYSQKYGVSELDCDVLKVGHHGSETSSMNPFLDFIKVEYAMISCGEGNKYAHPRQNAIDRMVAHGMDGTTIYRTDLQGTIVLQITQNGIEFTTTKTATPEQIVVGLYGVSD